MKIDVINLTKSFEDCTPLKGMNATINQGDIISVLGGSGSGKTTFIKCLNLLITPTSGDILVDGKSILDKEVNKSELRQKIGMVFQSFNLYSHLTVLENVMVPQIDLKHKTRQEAYDYAVKLLRSVGLGNKLFNYADELSGGQKQRVAIARTLALDPEVILFDEPTSALDPTMVGEVESVIERLAKEGKTIIIVTHQFDFAKRVSNRIFFLAEGNIYEEGTPEEIFDNPKLPLTKRFIRNIKGLDINIDKNTYDFIETCNTIKSFTEGHNLSKERVYLANLIFEEIVNNHLVNMFDEVKNISYSIDYIDDDEKCKIHINYGGGKFNILEIQEDLSLDFINKIIKKGYEYKRKDDENILIIRI